MKYGNTNVRFVSLSLWVVLWLILSVGPSNVAAETTKNEMPSMSHDMHSMHNSSLNKPLIQQTVSKKNIFKTHISIAPSSNHQHTKKTKTAPLHKIHNWVIHVENNAGKIIDDARLMVYGGMPMHKHGYSTNPQVTTYLGNGDYLIEGIKFSMAGYWEMWFNIRTVKNQDTIIFGLNIPSKKFPEVKTTKINKQWSKSQLITLQDMWLQNLPPLETDPSNYVSNYKTAAIFGEKLFFDARLSAKGNVSCSTCHNPTLALTDSKPVSKGIADTRRGSPSLLGASYNPWFFWDGRADSQWAQALGPLEDAREHGGNRTQYAHLIQNDPAYRKEYESIFGILPDMSDRKRFPLNAGPVHNNEAYDNWHKMSQADQITVTRIFVNIGKSIAAFERGLMPKNSRFDHYVASLVSEKNVLKNNSKKANYNQNEIDGLALFIGKAQCIFCHNGPLLTNHDFKNIGLPTVEKLGIDRGRSDGIKGVLVSRFTCLGKFSDAKNKDCAELKYIQTLADEITGAFKIPSLRNVSYTAPYMHSGQFNTLSEVLKHYQARPMTRNGHSDLLPIELTDNDLAKLEAFLNTL